MRPTDVWVRDVEAVLAGGGEFVDSCECNCFASSRVKGGQIVSQHDEHCKQQLQSQAIVAAQATLRTWTLEEQ